MLAQPYLLLLGLLAIGFIAKDKSIMTAASFLLLLRAVSDASQHVALLKQLRPAEVLQWFDNNGLRAGVIILSIGILAPIAKGEITWQHVYNTVRSPVGFIALGIGIFVSFAAARGVNLIAFKPQLVPSIIIGTIMGVAFFKGIPSGPVIASGILAIIIYFAQVLGINLV